MVAISFPNSLSAGQSVGGVSDVGSAEFRMACAGVSAPGVGVVPISLDSAYNVDELLKQAVERNGGRPLETLVATHSPGGNAAIGDVSASIRSLIEDGHLSPEGGTLALRGGQYSANDLQRAADENPGVTIVHQESLSGGVTIYKQGQAPQQDPNGSISDGGFGSRGCGTQPGYTPGEASSAALVSTRLI